ncbi:MAG: ribosome small subunit-dependent GTPase A [Reinekea sp.]
MTTKTYSLSELGWRPALQQQISIDDLRTGFAARVSAVFRDRIHVITEQGELSLPVTGILAKDDSEMRATTGDWLWLENETKQPLQLLERINVLSRTAAGSDSYTQLIAANIDTIFIVSSCNLDFNLSRLERYLSLVMAAHIPAVIVLTKADLASEVDIDNYIEQAQKLHRDVPVITVNALDEKLQDYFVSWLGKGQTIAFIGSSGVGKSTLTNVLLGQTIQNTSGIREQDAKGRHTTTDRSIHRLPDGGWVMDTPGMRELRLNDDSQGIAELFSDIEALSNQCRFNNCHHTGDKGCAIDSAIESGELDIRRWQSYQKLHKEAEQASLSKQDRKKAREQWGKDIARFSRRNKKIKTNF